MNADRFYGHNRAELGERVINAAKELKVTAFKQCDGQLLIDFEMNGTLAFAAKDSCHTLKLVQDLLAMFEQCARDEAAQCECDDDSDDEDEPQWT